MRRIPVLLLLAIVYLLHEDGWLWPWISLTPEQPVWLGLPAVFLYHVVYCLLVALMMAGVVCFAWPQDEIPQPAHEPSRQDHLDAQTGASPR